MKKKFNACAWPHQEGACRWGKEVVQELTFGNTILYGRERWPKVIGINKYPPWYRSRAEPDRFTQFTKSALLCCKQLERSSAQETWPQFDGETTDPLNNKVNNLFIWFTYQPIIITGHRWMLLKKPRANKATRLKKRLIVTQNKPPMTKSFSLSKRHS